jgi:hypothetical protein
MTKFNRNPMKKIYEFNKNHLIGFLMACILVFSGCKKYLQVDAPETKISTRTAFNNDNTATAVLTGIYAQLSDNYINAVNLPATSFFEELSADNLVLADVAGRPELAVYSQNNLDPTYSINGNQTYWTNTYKLLYTINSAIEALTNNTSLTPAVDKRLLGEAYFLRAFCYFYLTNLYGDVPLILTPNYIQNTKAGRTSSADVYNQIVVDLDNAEPLLDNNYAALDVTKTTTERVRPNLAAVNALKARVYLYQKNYQAAETAATKVITQAALYSFSSLDKVFLKNSSETIWALQPVNVGYNTREGQLYNIPPDGLDYERPVYASASLLSSFEAGDARKDNWVTTITTTGGDTYSYPSKYKVPFIDGSTNQTEYTIVLRLSEQYLIRAEARNEQGNMAGAIGDINVLRTRSRAAATLSTPNPLPDISASLTQTQLRDKILNERRVELFTEWGHRWFDLKRSNTLDAVMTQAELIKGGTWANYKRVCPIPLSDILLNPAITQNPGYPQ